MSYERTHGAANSAPLHTRRDRNRAGIALVVTLTAVGAGFIWYVGTLSAITEPPADDATPHQWWDCTEQIVTEPTPPECLTERSNP